MPSIHQFYGTRWNWLPDDEGGFPNQKVAFDGRYKIIYVNEGVTVLNVKDDIYSAWKEWTLESPEYPAAIGWKRAISAIGGEPLNDTLNVGSTFFLENNWRIQPQSSKTPYILTVNGNIYTREAGGNPFLFAQGASINLTRSNLVDQLVASASISEEDYNNIANKVWEYSQSINTGSNSYGALAKGIDSDLSDVRTEVDKTLKKGEFLALS
jgi:hypothetical protein